MRGLLFASLLPCFLAGSAQALVTPRTSHTSTLLPNGNILIAGGVNSAGTFLNSVEIYVSAGFCFQGSGSADCTGALPNSMNVLRASHTATLLPNGLVLVAGGVNGGGVQSTAELYDPVANTWSAPFFMLNGARYNHTATLMNNGKVLLAGGEATIGGPALTTCELYDPAVPGFVACGTGGPMSTARAVHTATLLFNGRVWVAGGFDPSANPPFTVTTEVYDPPTNAWTPAHPLFTARSNHTATSLGNGNVLVVGGINNFNLREDQGIQEAAELYDPVSDSIITVAPTPERISRHSATLEPTGAVELLGGLGNITTSYFSGDLPFNNGSQLSDLQIFVGTGNVLQPGGGIPGLSSSLFVTLNTQLSVPTAGTIQNGVVMFSSPTAKLSDAIVFFQNPGTVADLAGVGVGYSNLGEAPGQIKNQSVPLVNLSGPASQIIFSRQSVSALNPMILSNGDHVDFGVGACSNTIFSGTCISPAPGNPTVNLTGGSLMGTIDFNFPLSDGLPDQSGSGCTQGGHVMGGNAIITAGTITSSSYTVTLKGGTSTNFTGCLFKDTVANTVHFTSPVTVTFTGLTGTINYTAATGFECNCVQAPNPPGLQGMQLTGLSLSALYTVNPVDLSGANFHFDIATVAIRSMAFLTPLEYQPTNNTWVFGSGGGLPFYDDTAVMLPNQDIAIIGGQSCAGVFCAPNNTSGGPGRFYTFPNPQTSVTFQAEGSLAAARANHSVTVLPSGLVLAAGGTNGTYSLASAELYNPNRQTWSSAGNMNATRSLHAATLLTDGNVLVSGGFSTGVSTGEVNTAEIYYPPANSWTLTQPMTSTRSYHTSTLLPDGTVLVAGGYANHQYFNTAEIFDPRFNTWTPTGSMATKRSLHTATLLQNGTVLVAGGVNQNGIVTTAEIYNPATGLWGSDGASAPNTFIGRHSHTATLLRDGRALVTGGDDGSGEITKAQIYDPIGRTWLRTGTFPGRDMNVGRMRHSSVLLPTGKVMVIGGVTALNQAIEGTEVYDVDFDTWDVQGQMPVKRGFHSSVLLANNRVLNVGGYDGNNYLTNVDDQYYLLGALDQYTPGGNQREPAILGIDTMTALNIAGSAVTLTGSHFLGVTEASGGGAAGKNSSFEHPRVYLQRLDSSGNANGGGSGYIMDHTPNVFSHLATNPDALWSIIDSSVSVPLQTGNALPFGLYHARVADNAQFSPGQLVKIGPTPPQGQPGVPTGALVGSSSVAWTWTRGSLPPPSGLFTGYHVYNALTGVFLGTAPANAGNSSFVHQNLGTNAVDLIMVAAYNIGGDGLVSVATIPVTTLNGVISGLKGTPLTPTQLGWSWNAVSGATGYNVFSAATGNQLGSVSTNSFTETGLTTNTAYGVYVQALTPAGPGPLSPQTTNYTAAATPVPGGPPITNVTSNGFILQWFNNANPPYTTYVASYTQKGGATTTGPANQGLGISSFTVANVLPNTLFYGAVAGVNGDGVLSPFASLGSTYTLANPPLNLAVTFTLPSQVGLSWQANGNPNYTAYQVAYSTDPNFNPGFVAIPFTQNYTSLSAAVGGLLTSVTYYISVTAENQFGQKTGPALTTAFTSNGGGPPGSLVFNLGAGQGGQLSGNLPNTNINIGVQSGSFDDAVTLFISSGSAPFPCGGITQAINIVVMPPEQPHFPIRIAVDQPVPNPGNILIARYDPGSNTCVPLTSGIDPGNGQLFALTNHLSFFQVMQVNATGDLSAARVFPNPVYMNNQGYVTFDHLPVGTRVRVFTLKGEELFEGSANSSGMVQWFSANKIGRPVASGIYLAVLESGGDKRIMKVVVVR